MLVVAWGCSKAEPEPRVRSTNAYPVETLEMSRLKSQRVKELLVVLFEKDFAPEEWQQIFEKTQVLSKNKKQLRLWEGSLDPSIDLERGNRMAENAFILEFLGSKSAFLMSWSLADENCRIVSGPRLSCRPKNPNNPLNGGLPSPVGEIAWIEPNPTVSEVKIPYLSVTLEKADAPSFQVQLRLRLESSDAREIWLKGDAIPSEGSLFPAPDGTVKPALYRYGYAEMTLGQ